MQIEGYSLKIIQVFYGSVAQKAVIAYNVNVLQKNNSVFIFNFVLPANCMRVGHLVQLVKNDMGLLFHNVGHFHDKYLIIHVLTNCFRLGKSYSKVITN